MSRSPMFRLATRCFCPWRSAGPRCWVRATSSSASTRSTTPAIRAFEKVANLGTRAGISGDRFRIHAPLIRLTKAEIIRAGLDLGVDYSITVSCYQPDPEGRACGLCDACRLRRQGFEEAGVVDPTRYVVAA